MPKEHKKRGRREEKKRKREEDADLKPSQRRKSDLAHNNVEIILDTDRPVLESEPVSDHGPGALPFYGLLDDDEQEYFKRADSILELDQFPNQEERDLFLANVYKEANGKELKIANSQSCSRLMERLIAVSNTSQLKELFQKFIGQWVCPVQCLARSLIPSASYTSYSIVSPPIAARLYSREQHPKSLMR